MPRGIDSSGDPNRSVAREGIVRRIVSRFTDPEPSTPSPGGGGPPPPGPRTPEQRAARDQQAAAASRQAYAQPQQVFSLPQRPASDARVEARRNLNARVSSARNNQIGKPTDKSLGQWRTEESNAGRRPR